LFLDTIEIAFWPRLILPTVRGSFHGDTTIYVWSHITVRSNLDKHYVATEATLYQTRDKCNPEFLLVKLRHYGGDIKYLVTDRVPKPDPTTQTSCIFKSEDTILLSYGPQSGLHQYDRFIHKHGVPLRTARFASPIPIGQLAILLNVVQETSPPDDFESTERLFFRYVYPIWEVLCDVGNAVVRDDVRWKDYEAISYDQKNLSPRSEQSLPQSSENRGPADPD